MPVYVNHSQVIIRKSLIEDKYPGGVLKFKTETGFTSVPRNVEDKELLSFAAMNSDELELNILAKHFDYNLDEDNQLVHSNDFVIVERYGGKLWSCDWLDCDSDRYPTFCWDVSADKVSIDAVKWRASCPMNLIEKAFGSWDFWSSPIL